MGLQLFKWNKVQLKSICLVFRWTSLVRRMELTCKEEPTVSHTLYNAKQSFTWVYNFLRSEIHPILSLFSANLTERNQNKRVGFYLVCIYFLNIYLMSKNYVLFVKLIYIVHITFIIIQIFISFMHFLKTQLISN